MNRRFAIKSTIAAGVLATVTACAPANQGPDIVDIAVANENLSTLTAALQAAGLVETLQGDGPFTVFAPTDSAFAKLPAGTVESLLLPENRDELTAILTYHVVPGSVPAADILGTTATPATVNGAPLNVDGTGSSVRVNNATVIQPDVIASNGVIHVIDTVLLP